MRLSNQDDLREDLELAVMELQDRFNVSTRSVRKFVNDALKATEVGGVRGTVFLRHRWAEVSSARTDPDLIHSTA